MFHLCAYSLRTSTFVFIVQEAHFRSKLPQSSTSSTWSTPCRSWISFFLSRAYQVLDKQLGININKKLGIEAGRPAGPEEGLGELD